VFLPQILILFGFIAVLEDCGYMARAAFLMDKLMSRCGLSGKSFIPLLSSVACAVPGIMAARVIENRRDRLATILVAPLMSCSARLPVYLLVVGAFVTPAVTGWARLSVPGLVLFLMYALGLVLAPLVAFVLKKTLLRGQTPVFVMEMPTYKVPSLRTVWRRMFDAGGSFLKRAGTVILASMILVWVLMSFPAGDHARRVGELNREANRVKEQIDEGEKPFAAQYAELREVEDTLAEDPEDARSLARQVELKAELAANEVALAPLREQLASTQKECNEEQAEWKHNSYLGRVGQAIEPAVRPLGWDWKIGVAALASFPAREVVVGVLGVLYQEGRVDSKDAGARRKLGEKLRPLYSLPTALSLMVFFALCCQCASTLAVIRRETRSWLWPAFTFTYMTALAYVAALVVYQVGSWFT